MKPTKFHERIRSLRESSRLTVKEIAQQIGVPESTYREWEYGRAITGEPYLKLARVLGVDIRELLGDEELPKPIRIAEELKMIRKHLDQLELALKSFL
jgi:transcriptional regulator with XRE-family HTH domain